MFFLLCLCTWNFEKEWEQAQTNVTLEAKFLLLLLLFIILRKVDVTFACVYVRTLCTVPLNEMLEASTVYKASSILACIFEFCNKFPLFPTLWSLFRMDFWHHNIVCGSSFSRQERRCQSAQIEFGTRSKHNNSTASVIRGSLELGGLDKVIGVSAKYGGGHPSNEDCCRFAAVPGCGDWQELWLLSIRDGTRKFWNHSTLDSVPVFGLDPSTLDMKI